MNTQILHLKKYDLKGHKISSNFRVNPTFPLMDGPLMLPSQIVYISLFLTLHLVLYSPNGGEIQFFLSIIKTRSFFS